MSFFARNNCIRMRRLIHQRLDGELSPVDSQLLEAHLSRCPACAALADRLDAAASLLRSTGSIEPSSTLPARIKAAIARNVLDPQDLGVTRSPGRSFSPIFVRLATAGVVAVLALFLATTLRTQEVRSVPVPTEPLTDRLVASPQAETLPAPPASVASKPRTPIVTPEARRTITATASSPIRGVARRNTPRRVDRTMTTPPVPSPRAEEAMTRDGAEPTQIYRASSGMELAMADQRISVAPTSRLLTGGNAFTERVVSSLVADVMLASYLDGAPPGMTPPPSSTDEAF